MSSRCSVTFQIKSTAIVAATAGHLATRNQFGRNTGPAAHRLLLARRARAAERIVSHASDGGVTGARPCGSAPTTPSYSRSRATQSAQATTCDSTRRRSAPSSDPSAYAARSSTGCSSITALSRLLRRLDERPEQRTQALHGLADATLDSSQWLPQVPSDFSLRDPPIVSKRDRLALRT